MYCIKEYELNRRKYNELLDTYNTILSQKEELFQRTQPQAIAIKADKVSGGAAANPLEEYAIRSEQIDMRLTETRKLAEARKYLLDIAEQNLRASKGIYDRIYVRRYLDGERVGRIANELHYSRSQIFRILQTISRKSRRCD